MNSLVRMNQPGMPAVGTRQGNWVWDGTEWICDPDCGNGGTVPAPPFGPPVFSGPTAQPPWYPGANGGVSFGQTFPPNPTRGHLFWDGVTFWLFDGAAWNAIGGQGTPGGGGGSGGVIVSPTPPPTPVNGTQWWNGTILQVWNGTAWVLIGPSAVGPVGTTQITFGIAAPTGMSIAAAAWSVVPWTASPQIDTQTAYDPVTHKVTPKVAGVYLVLMRFPFGLANGQTGAIAVQKNDPGSLSSTSADIITAISTLSNASGPGSISSWITCAGVAQMNGTTDYLRAFAYHTGGTLAAAGSNPAFTIALLP